MTYIANLSSNRGMILKIFAILFVFLLFFGFVVVR
jgi:syntaxin 5